LQVCGVQHREFGDRLRRFAGPFREDQPLRVESASATGAFKKAFEILALHYSDRTKLEVITCGSE